MLKTWPGFSLLLIVKHKRTKIIEERFIKQNGTKILKIWKFSAYACFKKLVCSGDNIKAVARQPFDKGSMDM